MISNNDVGGRYYSNRSQKAADSAHPLMGIYVGIIRSPLDQHRSGRYEVEIPSLNKGGEDSTTYPCFWTSPFAGSTNPNKVGKNIESYTDTLKSYGLWMPPPDEGNLVLVAFGDGNSKLGYIISCIFPDRMTHMVPGMPAGKSYSDPSMLMPVAEKNKFDERVTHNDATRPLHVDIAEGIVTQGLINDPLRGAGTSGMRRGDINDVYGILTPGPKDPDNKETGHRLGGHQLIMDDKLDSRLVRLRTAGGNQLLMDDTSGIVYIINRKGTAWLELNTYGDIYMHSEGTIAMRAKGNFDLRADKNINIEAGQNVHIKAAGDNSGDQYLGIPDVGALGIPPLGNGGDVRIEGTADLSLYAGLNTQLTANGGDVDISAGSRVAATASGPLGMDLLAATGPIKMQSTLPTSVLSAAGFNVTSGAPTSIIAPLILLNSGGPPAIPALPAIAAPQIGTNEHEDNPKDPPKFDRDAAMEGKTSAPTAGERTGKKDKIKTIVSKLITTEPFKGHAKYDPVAESGKAPAPDPKLIEQLPAAAVDMSGKPVNVNTPNGYLKGTGYTDENGNPITGGASQAVDQVQGLYDKAQGVAQGAVDAATGAVKDAAGDLAAGIPNFEAMGDIAGNLKALSEFDLAAISGLAGLVAGIQIALPPIRFPTTNALAQKVIGVAKQLKEMEAQLKQFALDSLNLPMDLDFPKIANMKNKIQQAVAQAQNGAQLGQLLSESGIQMIQDGPGTIFQDAAGNKLVDFAGGLGPAGATLGLVGDLTQSFNDISSAVKTPLTANETLAMSNFARQIGTENFLKSDVLSKLNGLSNIDASNTIGYAVAKGNVLREMQSWKTAPNAPGESPVIQPGLAGMRRFESILFQCPDDMDVTSYITDAGYLPGSANFDDLADRLQAALDAHTAA